MHNQSCRQEMKILVEGVLFWHGLGFEMVIQAGQVVPARIVAPLDQSRSEDDLGQDPTQESDHGGGRGQLGKTTSSQPKRLRALLLGKR